MTWFEVYIPSTGTEQKTLSLTVEGPNWMDALRTGLGHIGESPISNIMCDVQEDNSIHVTDVSTQRVFRLREVAAAPAAVAPEPAEAAEAAPKPETKTKTKKEAQANTQSKTPPPKREAQFQAGPVAVQLEESDSSTADPHVTPAKPIAASHFDVTDMIADIFEATQELFEDAIPDPRKVAEKLLDLALAKVPADAGSFYLADLNSDVLLFAAVRGPKADTIKRSGLNMPLGQGIVGFCAQEGVCLVIRDMQQDTRYSAGIADTVGYQPRDTLCASVAKEGRLYGAIQLINAEGGAFDASAMEAIRYLSLTAADMLQRVADSA
jgi:putative methionine-R-sulfoxide reductase with GAF domain